MCTPQPRLRRDEGGRLRLAAAAKLNLNLLVGPRRDDGYHGLDSLVARVTLYDEISLAPRDDGRIGFACSGADCGSDEQNLALRAARLLAEGRAGCGADIRLLKRIPPGSGLGGGSADAAAVLVGLSELWGVGADARLLHELAGQLGSDVPAFLGPPAARVTGRGEQLEPVTVHPFWAVLHLSELACPTAEVYLAFDDLENPPAEQIDVGLLTQRPSQWRGLLVNQLLPATRRVAPELGRAYDALAAAAPAPVSMTGSGSGLFVLCDDLAEAQAVLDAVPPEMRGNCCIVRGNEW